MKNFNKLLILVGVVLFFAQRGVYAQGSILTYQAYVNNSQVMWDRAVSGTHPDEFSKAMAYYGLLNGTMADKDEDRFDKYYDQTLELFESLVSSGVKVAESKAVLSSVYGLAMAYDSWKGMYLGPKSGSLIQAALKTGLEIALVRKLYAGSKLYTPGMFGGDVSVALENFKLAIGLYEAESDTVNNWLYLDALAHLGITYHKLGKPDEAISIYEKALAIEPKFGWVKYNLLPSAQKDVSAK